MTGRRWLRLAWAAVFWTGLVAVWALLLRELVTRVWLPDPELLSFVFRGNEVKLLEPRALLLLGVLPVIPAVGWFTLTDFGGLQRLLNATLRIALLTAMVAAGARPSISRFDSHLCVVYGVDVSSSVPDEVLVAARELVQSAYDARGTNLVRLVTFAERPVVVPIAPGQRDIPALARHESGGLATDAAAALRLSYGLCPQDHIARFVLVSDGNENRGDLVAEAATAADFGVEVSTAEIPFDPAAEVMVRGLELPDDIEVSEPFTMIAEIYSNRETTARIDLQQNEFNDITGRQITLSPGVNRVELTAEVYEPGFRRFELRVRPDEGDRFAGNNTYVETVTVEGRPRVLYVEGEARSRVYLERALARDRNDLANFDLEVRTGYGFPNTVEELANFDLVMLSDVAARDLSRNAMGAVQRYVRELGGTFLMVGGERSFGPGGYDNTLFEDISPVTFDMQRERDQPALAIMLVIDRSGSMDGLKLEMAKDAARAVVDMLGPQDSIGVIAFDTEPETVVRLQQAGNRARIRSDIGRIGTGGGTDILPGLTEAYVALADRAARLKHVIVLTDGAAPWDGIADITSAMRIDGITVSAVAVGADADRSLLEMIAELGGGRFYATNDPSNIPQIFVQETSTVSRTNLVEEPFRPVLGQRSQGVRGINFAAAPYLLGYVQTHAKPRAEVILTTERGDPLLARWRLGLGRVAVFTSDCKNRWAVEWVRNRIYPQFWAQVIRDLMRVDTDEELAMSATVDEGVAVLSVDAIDANDRFVNGLTSEVEVTRPDGTRDSVTLTQVAAGRYEGRLPLDAYGPYLLRAEHSMDGAAVATSFGAVTYPYPDELLTFEPNREPGRQAAALTGGAIDPTPAALWDSRGEQVEYRRELWPYCLFAAVALLVADLLFRRLRVVSQRPRSWAEARAGL
ncbi:MAG: VWA domain-containing protein [Myxococcales bacterium]|nr:VWA domain-containing protein [Myxococcales bacterium]